MKRCKRCKKIILGATQSLYCKACEKKIEAEEIRRTRQMQREAREKQKLDMARRQQERQDG